MSATRWQHKKRKHVRKKGFVLPDVEGRFLVARHYPWTKRQILYIYLHTFNFTGMRVYKLACETPRRASTCPTRLSYLESLIDGIFAPSRARRPAGLKRRATNNEPRKFVPADRAILHATRRAKVNVHPIGMNDMKLTTRACQRII